MEQFTDDHRKLIQYFLSHRVVSEETVHQRFPDERFDDLLRDANGQLAKLQLEIKRIVAEESGAVHWGIVNLNNDELARLATTYTKPQIELFKSIVRDRRHRQLLMGTHTKPQIKRLVKDGEVMNDDAIGANPSLSRDQAENTLGLFVKDKWLRRDVCIILDLVLPPHVSLISYQGGEFLLGIRAQMELRPYLEESFGDEVKECMFCSEIIFKVSFQIIRDGHDMVSNLVVLGRNM